MLGLGYPGGAEVDRLARSGDPTRFDFPRGMLDSGDFQFSFSGLKTAVRVFLEKGFSQADLPDICASFQLAVVDVLVAKAFRAASAHGRGIVSMSGGVSANACLRAAATTRAEKTGLALRFAPDGLRTDNALMIAYAAAHHLAAGHSHPVSEDIVPNFDPTSLCV
jgi:N6-L-threonylcarbamoyladenine synthase